MFYRLIVTADDYGRLDGRFVVLKNDLFPTKDTITKKAVEDAISKLVSVGLLVSYVDAESNMPYLCFPKWNKHQVIRNKHSRYPAPPDDLIANCKQMISNCNQTLADCHSESESKIESESESESKRNNARAARFTPPTVEEVETYAEEKGYTGFSADRFMAYYESNGWKVGRNPMKDWRAAVRNWASRDSEKKETAVTSNPALQYAMRDKIDYENYEFIDLDKYGG